VSYRSKVALVYLLGFALDLVNMFAANIAYPAIAQELGASVAQLAWLANAYMLGLTLIIPLGVWLAAACGERRLILASLLLFTLASLLVGQAGSIEALLGWRVVQGLGGGLLIPVGQALAYRHTPPDERSRLTAQVMLVALLVPALSPALGGAIVDVLSWRWIFLANLPLAALAIALACRWLEPDPPAGARPPLDVGGLLLGGGGLTVLLVALSLVAGQEHRSAGLAGLVGAAGLLGLYVRDGWRKAQPILELRLVRLPALRTAMLVYLFVPGVFIGTNLIAILFFHRLGFSAAQTGGLMLPWALASGLAIAGGKVGLRRFGPRPLLLVGMLLQAAGVLLLADIAAADRALPLLCYVLMGLGGSLCSSTAQNLAFADLPAASLGHASALWNINRQLSFCLGAAVLGSGFGLLSPVTPQAFQFIFLFAALLTVCPLLPVLRLSATPSRVRHHPDGLQQHD